MKPESWTPEDFKAHLKKKPVKVKAVGKNTMGNLKAKAQRVFNKWIRKRDAGQPCINCGNYRTLQAGHLYPTSTHPHLRFNEHNTNGECLHCNFYNSQSHSFGYTKNLIKKIGKENFEKLEQLASMRIFTKDDRFYFEEIVKKYKL